MQILQQERKQATGTDESLKEEFSRRLGAAEKKLLAVTKERDELKKGKHM